MNVRAFKTSDVPELIQLFKDTVQHINRKHYTSEQIEAWTSADATEQSWSKRQSSNFTVVAEAAGSVVGFGELSGSGSIEMLYVHKNHQHKGIASSLMKMIEEHARALKLTSLTTEASITARPFFEKLGFKLSNAEHKVRNDVVLIQFRMAKQL